VEARAKRFEHVLKWCCLGATILLVWLLRYLVSPSHVVAEAILGRLYYLPIVLAAWWYGPAGGILAAVVTAAAYLSYLPSGRPYEAAYAASQGAEAVVFLFLGVSVGVIARKRAGRSSPGDKTPPVTTRAEGREACAADEFGQVKAVLFAGRIASGLAHEIRHRVAHLKTALDTISSRMPADSQQQESSLLARHELARLENLVAEFLLYARPPEPELKQARLVAILEQVRARVRPEAERAGVSVEIERHGSLPSILMDPRQIEHVLFNVTLNAVQASSRGARVVLRPLEEGHQQVVEVVDRGPGIATEYLDRVFDPFFTTKQSGLGLGLAISRQIVSAHYGSIELRRQNAGGMVVRIALPEPQRNGPPPAAEKLPDLAASESFNIHQ
jgi:two-component system sensor histidine kinase HydH